MFGNQTVVMADVEIDEEVLTSIAEQTGGQYFRAVDKQKLAAIYDQINTLEKSKVEVSHHTILHEEFLVYALAALAALVLEFVMKYLVLKRIP